MDDDLVHAIGVDCGVNGGNATDLWPDVTCPACLQRVPYLTPSERQRVLEQTHACPECKEPYVHTPTCSRNARRADPLSDLRAELDGVDGEIERTQKDKREASEALRRRMQAWDAHIDFLRHARASLVQRIKVASQRARGIRSRD